MRDKLNSFIITPIFWSSVAVFAATLIPYLQVGRFELINLDDYSYVHYSPVLTGLSAENVWWALATSFGYQGTWMPVTWISYMTDATLFGSAPGAMHLHNAILHALNAVLLFLLMVVAFSKLETGKWKPKAMRSPVSDLRHSGTVLWVAALSALFWSLHPLRVEPVAWISSRKDVLSFFWELLALIFWLLSIYVPVNEKQSTDSEVIADGSELCAKTVQLQDTCCAKRRAISWWLSVSCLALACMSKPTAITFPILACLLDFAVTRKIRWKALYAPCLIALGFAFSAELSQTAGGGRAFLTDVTFLGRLANAISALGIYCLKTVWPSGLAVPHIHSWPKPPAFFWQGMVICVAYGAVLLWSSWDLLRAFTHYCWHAVFKLGLPSGTALPENGPQSSVIRAQIFAGLSWFLIAVAPMLGIANFGFHAYSDRFTYLPAVGFSMLLFLGLRALLSICRTSLWVTFTLILPVIAGMSLLGGLSWRQVGFWKNDGVLFAHTVDVIGEDNSIAQRNLGMYHFRKTGDAAMAVPYWRLLFKHAREYNRMAQAIYVLLLAQSGYLEDAESEARDLGEWVDQQLMNASERSRENSDSLTGYFIQSLDCTLLTRTAYGALAYYNGDKAMAREHAEAVVAKRNKDAVAHYLLGLIASDEGRVGDAIDHWKVSAEAVELFEFLVHRIIDLESKRAATGTVSQ